MEKPVIRKLYRQSSVEMHLVPNPPPSTDDELDASDSEKSEQPKIVSATSKTEINSPHATDDDSVVKKTKISLDLERILANREQKISTGAIKKSIHISHDPESEKIQKKLPPQVPPRRSSKISTHGESSLLTNKSEECKIEKKYLDNNIDGGTPSKNIMASPRPKSPRPPAAVKNEKEESIWDKIGTLGRKKKVREVQEVQAEGKYAIDSPGNPIAPEMPPEDYNLGDNEERSMVEPRSLEEHRVRELMTVLIDWINDELANQRIIVKNLEEDLYDGQVLQKLLEKLTGDKLDVPEVTQSEEGQRQKLAIVLAHADRVLGLSRYGQSKWSVESIHSKNMVAILHLLVHLARHFRAPIRLPENVSVAMVVVQKGQGGQLNHRIVREQITQTYDDLGMRCERDAFDTLFDHAPDKLQVVKKSLVTFVNKHLSKVNLEVTELDSQFHDGVYLTLLMGLLEGFFVPLHCFHLTPQDFEQKVHNVTFAFELMEDVGLAKPKARPEDIVNLDLKSTLRVLYNLFTKYKSIS